MNALDTVLTYIGRGWLPVPVPYREKGPQLKGWQKLRIGAEEAPRYFNGASLNIGVLLGEASGGLVDVDLDCPQALQVASETLPPTDSVFGRAGKPCSHRIYLCACIDPETGEVRQERCETTQFRDPTDKAMLVELRGDANEDGSQTVFPGSTHASGEPVEWHADGDPGLVRADVLHGAVAGLAAVALLGKHWPAGPYRDTHGGAAAGGRHAANLVVAGWLTRSGLDEERVACLLERVSVAAGAERDSAKRVSIARDAAKRARVDGRLYGWNSFVDLFGEPVARRAAEWLNVGHGETQGEQPDGSALWDDPDLSILHPHQRPAHELPIDVFGPFWGRWIADAAEAKGSRPDFVAAALLAGASALVANARRASPWPGWVEPPILWSGVVGLPSSGKSPAQDAVMDLVRELERELDLDFDERTREHQVAREVGKAKRERWEAEVRLALKKETPPPEPPKDVEAPEPPARRRLYTNDATVERVARIAAVNDRGLLLSRDELAGWLGQLDKYGGNGSDRAFYLESYGGRPYVVDRVKDGTAVRVPFLSVSLLGGIQPDRLASLLLAGDDDGLAARFLYVWPEPARPTRPRRVPDDAAALAALRCLLTLAPVLSDGRKLPVVVPFEPAAADDLQAWREQVADMEGTAAGLFLSWLGKVPGMAVRIALLFELLWWCPDWMKAPAPSAVSSRAVKAALGFLEAYAVPMARRAFGEAALPLSDRDAIALARWLHGRRPVPEIVNARELRHADALPTRDAERYDRALSELEAAGWLRPAPRSARGGRPRKDWQVNPKIWDSQS